MDEIWKDITGYEGLYQVSNLGRVKSLCAPNRKGKAIILKPSQNNTLYARYTLFKDKLPRQYLGHRLVAKEFIPNPKNKPQVNHIDGNRKNNCISNLEWCDNSHNQKNAYMRGSRTSPCYWSGKKGKDNPSSIPVFQIDMVTNEKIRRFYSMEEAAMSVNGLKSCICVCCKGRRKSAYGYRWEYAEDDTGA